jgi:hypothetical protein
MPTALRAPMPFSVPKTSAKSSLAPLITYGCSSKSEVQLTIPSTLITRLILFKLPRFVCKVERIARPVCLAAALPWSLSASLPTRPFLQARDQTHKHDSCQLTKVYTPLLASGQEVIEASILLVSLRGLMFPYSIFYWLNKHIQNQTSCQTTDCDDRFHHTKVYTPLLASGQEVIEASILLA